MENVVAVTSIGFATLHATEVWINIDPKKRKREVVLYKDNMCERFERRICWFQNPPSFNDSTIVIDGRKYNLNWVANYYE